MPDDSEAMPSWTELTEEQQHGLYEGVTGASRVDVLNGWVRTTTHPYWNRKGAYPRHDSVLGFARLVLAVWMSARGFRPVVPARPVP